MTLMSRTSAACTFALACHFVAAPRLFGGNTERPSTDATHVANKVLENYKRFREIPNLTVDFEMTCTFREILHIHAARLSNRSATA